MSRPGMASSTLYMDTLANSFQGVITTSACAPCAALKGESQKRTNGNSASSILATGSQVLHRYPESERSSVSEGEFFVECVSGLYAIPHIASSAPAASSNSPN